MAGVGGILANIFGGIKNVVAGRRPGYRGPGERPAVTTLREKPQTRTTPQSSWITAIRWEPSARNPDVGVIIMFTKNSGKKYKFQAQDYATFEKWYKENSPGGFYWDRMSAGRNTLTAKRQAAGRPKAAAKAKAKAQFKRQYMRSAARTTRPGGGG